MNLHNLIFLLLSITQNPIKFTTLLERSSIDTHTLRYGIDCLAAMGYAEYLSYPTEPCVRLLNRDKLLDYFISSEKGNDFNAFKYSFEAVAYDSRYLMRKIGKKFSLTGLDYAFTGIPFYEYETRRKQIPSPLFIHVLYEHDLESLVDDLSDASHIRRTVPQTFIKVNLIIHKNKLNILKPKRQIGDMLFVENLQIYLDGLRGYLSNTFNPADFRWEHLSLSSREH